MKKLSATLITIAVLLMIGCGEKPAPSKAAASTGGEDPKLKEIKSSIAKMTPDAQSTLEKIKAMKPEVNGVVSAKSLNELVEDFSKNKGAYNLTPIGWEASLKKTNKWKVLFYYQDYQKQYVTAEWQYDPDTHKVYPFEKEHSQQFFALPEDKGKK